MKHLALLLALAACTEANHLGNPLTLPVRAVGTVVENAAYDRERGAVKEWIVANEVAMRAERFDGPVTRSLTATVPDGVRDKVRREVAEAAAFTDFVERATVIVMVHR